MNTLANSSAVNEPRLGGKAIGGSFTIIECSPPQLPDSVRDMEALFLAVIFGCHAGLFRDALHEVYIPRIQRGNASFAAKVLGVRGPLLLVLVHFFEHERWGSPAKTDVVGQSLTAEDQLFILMQSGLYLTATRGFAVPESRICYESAESLCYSLNRPLLLYVALIGRWRYSIMTEKLTASMQIARRIYSLAQEQNNSALMIGAHRDFGRDALLFGPFRDGATIRDAGCSDLSLKRRTVSGRRGPRAGRRLFVLGGSIRVASRRDRLLPATMAEAISLAKEVNDMHALTIALLNAACLAHFERNPAEVERCASDLIELCTRQNFATWLPPGAVLRGWARSALGDPVEGILWIEDGIRDYRATGSIWVCPII